MPSVSDAINSLDVPVSPFADDAPMDSLFFGAGRKAVLEQLQHLSRFSSDITVLLGPEGSGKSIVGDFFARQSETDQMVARISGNMLTSPAALLTDILNIFVLSYAPDATLDEMRETFVDFVRDARDRSRSVVLVVDDAHELGDAAFSMLTKMALARSDSGHFHLMLFGEPALVDMLECTCPLKNGNNQFTVSQLEPLGIEDTRHYLRFRLNSEGFGYDDSSSSLPFSDRQIERIHKQSGGIPGVMHGLAAFEFQSPTRTLGDSLSSMVASFPRQYAYGGLALLVVLFGVTVFMGGGEPTVQEPRSVSLAVPVASNPTDSGSTASSPEIVPVEASITDASAVEQESAAAADVSPFVPAPALTPPAGVMPDQTASAVLAPQQAPLQPPEEPAVVSVPEPVVPPVPEAPTAPRPSTPPVAAASSAPSSSVMDLVPDQYTIQLLGASSKANIEDFLRRNAGDPLYMFESSNRGRPWYVVIHGTYSTRAAASSAAARLGPKLAVDQPWIRRIGDVQSDVNP